MEFNTRAGIRTVKDGRWRWLLQSQGYVFRSNPYVKFRKTVNKTNSYFAKKKFYLTVLRESTGIILKFFVQNKFRLESKHASFA